MNDKSDIGTQLKESREKRKLSLEDVSHQIRIPLATLSALEENDYSSFASPAYTKSFLQQYSDFLKIDAHEIVDNLNAGNVLASSDSIEYLDQGKSTSPARSAPVRRNSSKPDAAPSSNGIAQPLLILLITGGLLAGGIWAFIEVEKRFNSESNSTSQNQPEKTTTTPPDGSGTEQPAAVTENSQTTPTTNGTSRPARVIGADGVASTDPVPEDTGFVGPVIVFPEDDPPPRAIIINEDEDE